MTDLQTRSGRARTGPWQRLTDVLRFDRSDILTIMAFAVAVGVLSIATPAAIEALVNTVAFGVQLWPVIVLALVMFGFLALAATLRATGPS
jgi:ABC-type bacteriocin/lantibiotic exporter with double-glycine peptidase domain